MPTKRKSNAIDLDPLDTTSLNTTDSGVSGTKKARTSTKSSTLDAWKDIELEVGDEGGVPVYDDCAEVRRKIRLLEKTPGWKVTQWLKEIGNINSNSFRRFMTAKGRNDGAANGTYYAAYVYFEKVRILEGKKKTTKRLENETLHSNGFPLCNPPRYLWAPSR